MDERIKQAERAGDWERAGRLRCKRHWRIFLSGRDKIAKDMMVRLDVNYTTALQLKRDHWQEIKEYKAQHTHLSLRECAIRVLWKVWHGS